MGPQIVSGDECDLLVVDDNPGDVRFIEEAFAESARDLAIHTASTVAEALDYLHGRGAYGDAPNPDVIFLDWHLPPETGGEVLRTARRIDPSIPVVVMTGSTSAREMAKRPARGADRYVEKPTDPEAYVELLRSLLAEPEAR